ncbi:MAG: hypothetical protein ACMG6S_11480 [Byssovorax sp.]
MRSRRALALLACVAVAFVAQASCVNVFGVKDEEDRDDVVDKMCSCVELQSLDDCEKRLGDRFANATSASREDWLDSYSKNGCAFCKNVLTCLSVTPTCSVGRCTLDEECCQVSDAGVLRCIDGSCK